VGEEEKKNAYRLLVGEPEGKRPLGRLETGWGGVDWIGLVNVVMNLQVP
jgi:hypothetical protein